MLTKFNKSPARRAGYSFERFLTDEYLRKTSGSDAGGDYVGQKAKLEWLHGWRPNAELRHWSNMYAMISDESDQVMVDYVGRVESIGEHWQVICDQARLPYSGLPSTNSSGILKDYALYSERAKEDMRRLYGRDLDAFRWSCPR